MSISITCSRSTFDTSRNCLVPISANEIKMSLISSSFGGRRNSIFDPVFLDHLSFASEEASAMAKARVDWKESPEAHAFKADLPGMKKEEVKVEAEEGRVLQIRGERSVEKEDKNDRWHQLERSSGTFVRRIRLPENALSDQVKASMEHGVLTVTVPKAEVKKANVKTIDISG